MQDTTQSRDCENACGRKGSGCGGVSVGDRAGRAVDVPSAISAFLKALRKTNDKAARAEEPARKDVLEALGRLAPHVGKVVEVHYLSGGKPQIARDLLMESPTPQHLKLGSMPSKNEQNINAHHLINWDWFNPVDTEKKYPYVVVKVLDAGGKILFERTDVPFDGTNPKHVGRHSPDAPEAHRD